MNKNKIKSKLILIAIIAMCAQLLLGCQTQSSEKTRLTINNSQKNELWGKLGKSFQWNHQTQHKRVQYHINKYKSQGYHFQKLSQYASPYLFYVVNELEKQKLPGELAILPMIESAYQPHVVSSAGASGIWQLGKSTAKRFGVKNTPWYDGRKDVIDSTQAAISYLKFLHKEFKGDWLLVLAAYNAGDGRVRSAIRANAKQGKSTKYWDLNLPKETKEFVPKILAMAHLIKNHNKIGLNLSPIKNTPYFVKVDTNDQIDLRVAADLAEISYQELKKLNPGYLKHSTPPKGSGPHNRINLPKYAASKFKSNLNKTTKSNVVTLMPYVVKSGDNLSKIASTYKTSVSKIKNTNKLKSNIIIAGNEILIPIEKINKNTTATTAEFKKNDLKNI